MMNIDEKKVGKKEEKVKEKWKEDRERTILCLISFRIAFRAHKDRRTLVFLTPARYLSREGELITLISSRREGKTSWHGKHKSVNFFGTQIKTP